MGIIKGVLSYLLCVCLVLSIYNCSFASEGGTKKIETMGFELSDNFSTTINLIEFDTNMMAF